MLTTTKGSIHLQALAVSLDPSNIPDGAPRGIYVPGGPGTFSNQHTDSTSFLFNKSLVLKKNTALVKFVKVGEQMVIMLRLGSRW